MTQLIETDDQGYIPLKRKFFKNKLWEEPRIFSRAEAWLDLIRTARFEEEEHKAIMAGRLVCWKRGQLVASLRYLSKRWKWGKHKVDNFFKLLKDEEMIETHNAGGITIVTLSNYELHNSGHKKGQEGGQQKPPPEPKGDKPGATNGDASGDARGTRGGQPGDKTNKVNKGNKVKEGDGAKAPTPPDPLFIGFQEWILKFAPRVAQMKEPITEPEWRKLRKKVPRETVTYLLQQMHNRKDLFKNISAYLTLLNWARKEYNQPGAINHSDHNGQHNGTTIGQGAKLKAAIQQIESQAGN